MGNFDICFVYRNKFSEQFGNYKSFEESGAKYVISKATRDIQEVSLAKQTDEVVILTGILQKRWQYVILQTMCLIILSDDEISVYEIPVLMDG